MSIITAIKTWWTTKTPVEKVETVFNAIASVAMIGGAAYCGHKLKEDQELIQFAVGKIGDSVDVKVSDDLIDESVKKATEKKVAEAVNRASWEAINDIREETKTQVRNTVKDAYGKITTEVSDRLAKECEKLNKTDILNDIRDKAKESLSEKFDEKLDDIAEEYSKNLSNMGKIYEALAEKMNQKA